MVQGEKPLPTCFVVMPISDVESYEAGHFGRVYEFIIKPACNAAGFKPIRADEVQVTNYIVVDILKRILEADLVICDLSSRNPNVLYELGVRQAFNLPVTLIRDSRTPRVFDIQGLRDIEYDESLRIDKINSAVEAIANVLRNTSKLKEGEVNSIIQLLGVKPAQVPQVEVSTDTSLLLNAIGDISRRLSRIEDFTLTDALSTPQTKSTRIYRRGWTLLPSGVLVKTGDRIRHSEHGEGEVHFVSDDSIAINLDSGKELLMRLDENAKKKLSSPSTPKDAL